MNIEDAELWKCDGCGFVGMFTDPWSATKLDLDADRYYLPCPFCEGQIRECDEACRVY